MFAARPCAVPGKGQHVCRGAALAACKACFSVATALSGCAAAAVLGDLLSRITDSHYTLPVPCYSAVTVTARTAVLLAHAACNRRFVDWEGRSWWRRAFSLVTAPLVLLMHATNPSLEPGAFAKKALEVIIASLPQACCLVTEQAVCAT